MGGTSSQPVVVTLSTMSPSERLPIFVKSDVPLGSRFSWSRLKTSSRRRHTLADPSTALEARATAESGSRYSCGSGAFYGPSSQTRITLRSHERCYTPVAKDVGHALLCEVQLLEGGLAGNSACVTITTEPVQPGRKTCWDFLLQGGVAQLAELAASGSDSDQVQALKAIDWLCKKNMFRNQMLDDQVEDLILGLMQSTQQTVCSRASCAYLKLYYKRTSPLHELVASNDYGSIRLIPALQLETAVQCVDENGRSPLHLAKTREVAELLLRHGANPHLRDNLGCTPLHYVSTRRHAKLLLDPPYSVDILQQSHCGLTPLHYASDADLVRFLVSRGIPLEPKSADGRGDSPLAYAPTLGVVRELVQSGCSALSEALVHARSATVAQFLVDAGADAAHLTLHQVRTRSAAEVVIAQQQDNMGDDSAGGGVAAALMALDAHGCTPLMAALRDFPSCYMEHLTRETEELILFLISLAAGTPATGRSGSSVPVALAAVTSTPTCTNTNTTVTITPTSTSTSTLLHHLLHARSRDAGDTAAHYCARLWPTVECVYALLDAGADFSIPNYSGETPFHVGFSHFYHPLYARRKLRLMIESMKDVCEWREDRAMPSRKRVFAAHDTAWDSVRLPRRQGATLLHLVCKKARKYVNSAIWPELAQLLINRGVDVNATNNCGETALHILVTPRRKHLMPPLEGDKTHYVLPLVRLLVSAGANVHATDLLGYSPFELALMPQSGGMGVEERRALRKFFGAFTPLSRVLVDQHDRHTAKDVAALLADDANAKGGPRINIDARETRTRASALHLAVRAQDEALVKVLVCDGGADPNARNQYLETAVFAACLTGNVSIARFLIQHGGDTRSSLAMGWTLLGAAVVSSSLALVQYLVGECGLPPDELCGRPDERISPLGLTCLLGHVPLVQYLLSASVGASVDSASRRFGAPRDTPLALAAGAGRVAVVALLLQHGADVRSQHNFLRRTSLHLAAGGPACAFLSHCASDPAECVAAAVFTPFQLEGMYTSYRPPPLPPPLSVYPHPLEYLNVVQLLLQHGAPLDVPDAANQWPLDVALTHCACISLYNRGETRAETLLVLQTFLSVLGAIAHALVPPQWPRVPVVLSLLHSDSLPVASSGPGRPCGTQPPSGGAPRASSSSSSSSADGSTNGGHSPHCLAALAECTILQSLHAFAWLDLCKNHVMVLVLNVATCADALPFTVALSLPESAESNDAAAATCSDSAVVVLMTTTPVVLPLVNGAFSDSLPGCSARVYQCAVKSPAAPLRSHGNAGLASDASDSSPQPAGPMAQFEVFSFSA